MKKIKKWCCRGGGTKVRKDVPGLVTSGLRLEDKKDPTRQRCGERKQPVHGP